MKLLLNHSNTSINLKEKKFLGDSHDISIIVIYVAKKYLKTT